MKRQKAGLAVFFFWAYLSPEVNGFALLIAHGWHFDKQQSLLRSFNEHDGRDGRRRHIARFNNLWPHWLTQGKVGQLHELAISLSKDNFVRDMPIVMFCQRLLMTFGHCQWNYGIRHFMGNKQLYICCAIRYRGSFCGKGRDNLLNRGSCIDFACRPARRGPDGDG
jgi:hypothetical protein